MAAATDPRGVFKALAAEHGLRITSEHRPGARTKRGTLSDHAHNRALDVGGDPRKMAAFAEAIATRYPELVKEMIYSPRGHFEGGRWVKTGDRDHHDHVHVSWGADAQQDELSQIASAFLSRGGGGSPRRGGDDLDAVASSFLQRKPKASARAALAADPDPLDRVAGDFLKRQPRPQPTTAPASSGGKVRQLNLSPEMQAQQAQALSDAQTRRSGVDPDAARRETRLGGMFATGSAAGGGSSMQTFGKVLFKTDDAANAAAASVARTVRKKGAAALADPSTYKDAARAGEKALVDLQRETPPTAVRELFGMEKGKTGRAAYNAAAVADYITSGLLAPSNLMVGPVFEAAAPVVKGAVKIAGKAALRGAETVAPGATRATVRAVKVAGERVGVGAEARAGRQAQKSLDIDLGARMQDAGQIVREARDATIRMRKKSPQWDQAERAFAAQNGGKSRTQHLIERFVTDPNGALAEARQLGIDPGMVKHFGARARAHSNETLARLQKHGVKVPAAQRGDFRRKYVGQMFGRTGDVAPARQAAVLDLTERLVTEGVHVAPVAPGQPLRPGWAAVPNDPATYGKLAGQQAPRPIVRLIEDEAKRGSPEVLNAGSKILRMWENVVGVTKAGYLANPATLSMNLGSNAILAELAARRARVNPLRIMGAMPSAIKETAAFLKTGRMSKDITEFSRYSRGFTSTEASTAGLGRGVSDVAGTGGSIFRPLGAGGPAVRVPPPREAAARALNSATALHGASEQASKLALFKALKPKVGAQRAAQLVDQHLFDYSDRNQILAAMDRLGAWAFNVFPLKSIELAIDTLTTRPDLLLRYPRLARLIREDMGETDNLQDLPAARQGPLAVPLGDGRWADVSRALPFVDAFALPDTAARIATEGFSQDDLLGIARRTIPGAAVANLGFNRDLWGGEIAKPGLPPGEGTRARVNALGQSYLPPLISRQIPGLIAAGQGEPSRGGVLAEPESVGEAISRNAFGVPITRAESFEAKKERLAETLEERAELADELVSQYQDALDGHGEATLPERDDYLRHAQTYRDYAQAMELQKQAKQRLWELSRSTSIFEKGRLTEDGRHRLRRLATWVWALGQR